MKAENIVLNKNCESFQTISLRPPIFKDFIKKYVATQGISVPDKNVPLRISKIVALIMGFTWKTFNLKGRPPLYIGLVNALGLEFTINDSKAREELGYKTFVSIEQGLKEMKQ